MSSGEFGPTYQEIRNINKLKSTDASDDVLDDSLQEAFEKVQQGLKVKFTTEAAGLELKDYDSDDVETDTTGIILNSRDIFHGKNGSIVFLQDLGPLGNIQSITSVEYRMSDSDSWLTQDLGQQYDYIVDFKRNAIQLNFLANVHGWRNIRIAGFYGVVCATSFQAGMAYKYKQLIALLGARIAVEYAAGASWDDLKTSSIFEITTSYGEFSPNYKTQIQNIQKRIDQHLANHGFSLDHEAGEVD